MLGLNVLDRNLLEKVAKDIKSAGTDAAAKRLQNLNPYLFDFVCVSAINASVDSIPLMEIDAAKAATNVENEIFLLCVVVIEGLVRAARREAAAKHLPDPSPGVPRPVESIDLIHVIQRDSRDGEKGEVRMVVREKGHRISHFSLKPAQLPALRESVAEMIRLHSGRVENVSTSPAESQVKDAHPIDHCITDRAVNGGDHTDKLVTSSDLADVANYFAPMSPTAALADLAIYEPDLAGYIGTAIRETTKRAAGKVLGEAAVLQTRGPLLKAFVIGFCALRRGYAHLWEGTDMGQSLVELARIAKQRRGPTGHQEK